jgi:hypothetical protein
MTAHLLDQAASTGLAVGVATVTIAVVERFCSRKEAGR